MRMLPCFLTTLLITIALQASDAAELMAALQQDDKKTRSGTVVDEKGVPVEGARVFAVATLYGPGAPISKMIEGTATDKDGHFSVSLAPLWENNPESARHAFVIYKPGFEAHMEFQRRNSRLIDDQSEKKGDEITLTLQKSLSVEVVNSDGSKAAIKSVRFSSIRKGNSGQSVTEDFNIPLPIEISGNVLEIDWLPKQSTINVDVETAEQVIQSFSIKASAERSRHKATLLPMTQINGRIKTVDDAAIPNNLRVDLHVARSPAKGRQDCLVWQTKTAQPDEQGEFSTSIAVGKLSLSILRGNLSLIQKSSETQQNEATNLELELPIMKVAFGRVFDSDGNPLPGVQFGGDYVSNLEGEFQVEFVESNPWVSISKVPKDYLLPINGRKRVDMTGKPDEQNRLTLDDFVLRKAAALCGRVVDESGQPVANANVNASWYFRESSYGTTRGGAAITDAQGNFEIQKLSKRVEIGLLARTAKLGSAEQKIVSITDDAERIELVVSEAAMMNCKVKVADQKGRPVKDALIELSYKRLPPGINGTFGWNRVARNEEFKTDAEGLFSVPNKLLRCEEYSVRVTAKGFVDFEQAKLTVPKTGDWTIDKIRMQATRSVSGVVVDSHGKPVSGANVWSYGVDASSSQMRRVRHDSPSLRVSATTDGDGKFQLENLHPDATFVLVQSDDHRPSGSPIIDSEPVTLKLSAKNESVTNSFSFEATPGPEQQELMAKHIASMKEFAKSSYTVNQILQAYSRVGDKDALRGFLVTARGSTKAQVLAGLGFQEDAIEVCQAIVDPRTRVRALTACAQSAEKAEDELAFLTEAGFELANVANTASRVESSSLVIDQLIDLGQTDAAQKIADGIVPAALAMNMDGRNEFSKAWLAKAVVRLDYELAWNLIKGSRNSTNQTSGGFARHCGNMAHELAAENPEQAEKLLNEIEAVGRARYIPRVAYRMTKSDPERAVKILNELVKSKELSRQMRPRDVANGFSAVAIALAENDPQQAKHLMEKAIDLFEPQRMDKHVFGTSLLLLSRSTQVDEALAEKAFWKLVDLYANPNVQAYSVEELESGRIRQRSELALILTLTDRFPQLRAELVDQIFQYFSSEGELDRSIATNLSDLATSFAAMALADPARTVEWHTAFYQKIPEKQRRYIPMPWVVITNALSMNKQDLCKYLAGETLHQWVIDEED